MKELLLFYDKFNKNHSFSNDLTANITLNTLFTSDLDIIENDEAVKEFNKFGGIYTIDNNIDYKMYKVIMFKNPKTDEKHTIVEIQYDKLKKLISDDKKVPNPEFLRKLAYFNKMYSIKKESTETRLEKVINNAMTKLNDPSDKMIENPDFLKNKLFQYQKRTINWMIEQENNENSYVLEKENGIYINEEIYYDTELEKFVIDKKEEIKFNGSALIDAVGLGKTIQLLTLSLLNVPKDISIYRKGINFFNSRATLIVTPSQIACQWSREIEIWMKKEYKVILLLTKVHFDKCTYFDMVNADFVITSYAFLENKHFIGSWAEEVHDNKNYYKSKDFSETHTLEVFEKMGKRLLENPANLLETNPNIFLISWERVALDEFHEIYTVDKYKNIKNLVPLFKAKHKWCITATPFDKNNYGLIDMINFVTGIKVKDNIINNDDVYNHLINSFFRRNTKAGVIAENSVPPYHEEIIWLKFSETERMIYNAYLVNNNIDRYSELLRQICCHPMLAEAIKNGMSENCTLEEIKDNMVSKYKKDMDDENKNVKKIQRRIERFSIKILRFERKRMGRLIKKKGYKPTVDLSDLPLENNTDEEDVEDNIDEDEEDDDGETGGKPITISKDNIKEVMKIIGSAWNERRVTLDKMYLHKENLNIKLNEAKQKYNGTKDTYTFYNNVMEKIEIIKETNRKRMRGELDEEEEKSAKCTICMDKLNETDLGVTKCGHLFCGEEIKDWIKDSPKCPICSTSMKLSDIYTISYEMEKVETIDDAMSNEKSELINKVGTKLGNLILFLKSSNKRTIVFSQWSSLLDKVGVVLSQFGIRNVYCKGNVWVRNKAITSFCTDDKINVIMLSSDGAAAGANLTQAEQVILLDPVTGSYEKRMNIENQAIGRAHRTGLKHKLTVYRFIIKDTIEEEIYLENKRNDEENKKDIEVIEINDSEINVNEEMLEEITSKTNKIDLSTIKKTKKKVETKMVVNNNINNIEEEFNDF